MASPKLEPVGDHTEYRTSEDVPGGTVIPSAANRKEARKKIPLELVTAEIEEGVSVVYDQRLYLGLASGSMMGKSEEDIVNEAARITTEIRRDKLGFDEALVSTRTNGKETQLAAPPTAVPVVSAPPAPDTDQKLVTGSNPSTPDLKLPKVRVAFELPTGTLHTRYHFAERTGNFLVLIFDKSCEVADAFVPVETEHPFYVSVGEGPGSTKFLVQSLGVNLDIAPNIYNSIIIALFVIPEPEPETQPEVPGLDMEPETLGQSTL